MFQTNEFGLHILPQDSANSKLVFYPGYDADMSMKAVKFANTIIASNSPNDTGRVSLINSIVKSLIENNSGDSIDISIYDNTMIDCIKWFPLTQGKVSVERYMPHFKHFCIPKENYTSTDYIEAGCLKVMSQNKFIDILFKEVNSRLNSLLDMYDYYDYSCYIDGVQNPKMSPHIVIINEFINDGYDEDKLLDLLTLCERAGVYVILTTQCSSKLGDKVVFMCGNRFALHSNKNLYAKVLGREYEDAWLPQYGYVYYKDAIHDTAPDMLKITFYPNTFLRKFVGSYSIRR